MSAIKFACVCPHPPVLVHEVGRGRERETQRTIDALEQVAEEMARHRPETVVLMATHGPLNPKAFYLLTAAAVEGDFSRWGAPSVRFRFPGDPDVAAAIREEAERAGLPLEVSGHWNGGLDWSCTVPLYYLRSGMEGARLVPMNISFLPPRDHFELGRAVRRAVDRLGRRVAIVASAELSHRLSDDGPYGFHPAGPELDRRVQKAVARWDVGAILGMDVALREAAGDDAVPSISFLMGALDGLPVRPRVLSYEGPFGVGYMVAAVEIGEAGEEEQAGGAAGTAEERRGASAQEKASRAAKPEHPFVRLARSAVEAWVRHRQVLEPPVTPELRRRAGVFVSIKKKGLLRGCIGTVEPTQDNLAREIVWNAISSASRDPRFEPITEDELPELAYSVDVLSEPEAVAGPEALDSRQYGVIVQSGHRRGLLLPDLEGVDDVETQIAIACSKAGILPGEPIELYRFQVQRYT